MKISIITLFPEIIEKNLTYSILKRAQEKKLVEFAVIDHRQFGIGTHHVVDDKAYGGGVGMILKVDVLADAINSIKSKDPSAFVILLDPQGVVYSQEIAENLTKYAHIVLVCGHYEGFDERIRDLVDMEISIGDYVLTGGEIASLALCDSITRLLPGVLKDSTATADETHSLIDGQRILEGPQYTRPEEYRGMKVPSVYLSGDPKKIDAYKKEKALEKTHIRRPELIKTEKN